MDANNPAAEQNFPIEDINKGKTIAILAYCTLIGFIIAIIMHQSERTKFGAFHIRQALGLIIFVSAAAIVAFALIWLALILLPAVQITAIVFLIMGIINAANGKAKKLPLIGELSEKMLSGIQ